MMMIVMVANNMLMAIITPTVLLLVMHDHDHHVHAPHGDHQADVGQNYLLRCVPPSSPPPDSLGSSDSPDHRGPQDFSLLLLAPLLILLSSSIFLLPTISWLLLLLVS